MTKMIALVTLAAALCAPTFADAAPAGAPVAANAPTAWQPEDGDRISFTVLRKGKAFGTHTVDFDVDKDGSYEVETNVSLKAGLGPITMFKYDLSATEQWEDGQLVAVNSRTNDDGKTKRVSAELIGGELEIQGSAYIGTAPAGIIPSSHWNIQQAFSSEILSTETGAILDTKVTPLGKETLTINGQPVEAMQYRLVSDLTVDLWYDERNRWVKLSFEARGQQIDYVLDALY